MTDRRLHIAPQRATYECCHDVLIHVFCDDDDDDDDDDDVDEDDDDVDC